LPEKRKKSAVIALRVMPELKKAARLAAAADQRPLNQLIEKLLIDHLRKTGHIEAQKGAVTESTMPAAGARR
jgi:hypothetical protein